MTHIPKTLQSKYTRYRTGERKEGLSSPVYMGEKEAQADLLTCLNSHRQSVAESELEWTPPESQLSILCTRTSFFTQFTCGIFAVPSTWNRNTCQKCFAYDLVITSSCLKFCTGFTTLGYDRYSRK